jgi:outer membrane protein W
MHNEDSHWLRTGASQLGPAPNVIMDGDGFGFQGQLGLEYFLTPRLAMNLDFRYWSLMSDGEITTGVSTSSPSTFPLNDLDTTRYGVQMGVTYAL